MSNHYFTLCPSFFTNIINGVSYYHRFYAIHLIKVLNTLYFLMKVHNVHIYIILFKLFIHMQLIGTMFIMPQVFIAITRNAIMLTIDHESMLNCT